MKFRITIVLYILVLFAHSADAQHKPRKPVATPTAAPVPQKILDEKTISQVVSGDTLIASDNTIIRLAGLDCYDPLDFGWVDSINPGRRQIASEAVKRVSLLVLNKTVQVDYPIPDDVYGRKWAYVFLPDGSSLNKVLLEEGLAQILPGTPDHTSYKDFDDAQKTALNKSIGIWSVNPNDIKINLGDYDNGEMPDADDNRYVPPSRKSGSHKESGSEGFKINGVRIFMTGLVLSLMVGLFYFLKQLTDTKVCPLCNDSIPKRSIICPNCNYNYKTGFLGDSELQQWVTRNIRVGRKKDSGSAKK